MNQILVDVYTVVELKEVNPVAYGKVLEENRAHVMQDMVYQGVRERAVDLLRVCGFVNKYGAPNSAEGIEFDAKRGRMYVTGNWLHSRVELGQEEIDNHTKKFGDDGVMEVIGGFQEIAKEVNALCYGYNKDAAMVMESKNRGRLTLFECVCTGCHEGFAQAVEETYELELKWMVAYNRLDWFLRGLLKIDVDFFTSEKNIVETLMDGEFYYDKNGRLME